VDLFVTVQTHETSRGGISYISDASTHQHPLRFSWRQVVYTNKEIDIFFKQNVVQKVVLRLLTLYRVLVSCLDQFQFYMGKWRILPLLASGTDFTWYTNDSNVKSLECSAVWISEQFAKSAG
jgi:hypothetical protein